MRIAARRLLLLALCGTGCWASEAQLRMRAASDLDCNRDQLTIRERDGVHRVTGCGQEESYVFDNRANAWLRASESGGRVVTRER